jgi:glycosyltransferase involved in cell wall biosynthesis
MRKSQQVCSPKPKVLCVDQYADIGGGQRSLLDLLPAFSERGWEPSIAAPGSGPFERQLCGSGYPTYNIVCGSYSIKKKRIAEHLKYGWEIPSLVKALDYVIAEREITLLYVNGPRLVPAAAWVARKYRIPMVFHCHNRLLQHSAIALAGESLRLTDSNVIACCQYAAAPLEKYIRPGRLKIIFNGVRDMAVERRRPGGKIRRIGVVGRIEIEKGQAHFIEAARLVLRSFPDSTFTVIGTPMFSGADYYARVLESSRGLPFRFSGWRDDVAQAYADLDLLVVPSSALEATTRVVLEAYSAGVPAVAFPSGGIPEVLQDNETGFLTVASTPESLADRIVSILSKDTSTIAAVLEKARRRWSERYTLEAYREGVCGVLSRAAKAVAACQPSCETGTLAERQAAE